MVSVTKHPDGDVDVDMSDDELYVRFEIEVEGHVPTVDLKVLEEEVARRLGDDAENVSITGLYEDATKLSKDPAIKDKWTTTIEGVYVLPRED